VFADRVTILLVTVLGDLVREVDPVAELHDDPRLVPEGSVVVSGSGSSGHGCGFRHESAEYSVFNRNDDEDILRAQPNVRPVEQFVFSAAPVTGCPIGGFTDCRVGKVSAVVVTDGQNVNRYGDDGSVEVPLVEQVADRGR
jgi:hypothetical protein